MNADRILQQQIGSRAFTMMGARNLLAIENGLQWKVGRGPLGVTHVRVTLEPTDTYKVETFKVRGTSTKALDSRDLVHVAELRRTIEALTGLALSL